MIASHFLCIVVWKKCSGFCSIFWETCESQPLECQLLFIVSWKFGCDWYLAYCTCACTMSCAVGLWWSTHYRPQASYLNSGQQPERRNWVSTKTTIILSSMHAISKAFDNPCKPQFSIYSACVYVCVYTCNNSLLYVEPTCINKQQNIIINFYNYKLRMGIQEYGKAL